MNKNELVTAIAEAADLSKTKSELVLNTVLRTIQDTLTAGGEVQLPGLGKFSVSERAARTGRNPQTGATIDIAASKAVQFKAAKPLKDAING